MVDLPGLLTSHRIMAIVRAATAHRARTVIRELRTHGVHLTEITLNTPEALDLIADSTAGDTPVGAGTVLTARNARDAVAAGASYLVTPAVLPEVLDTAQRLDVPVLCGAHTPTEVLQAMRTGATAVKVFPASLGGPPYLSALRAPMPAVPLVAVGGVDIEDVPAYLEAGAMAVGIGSPLTEGDVAERCARLRKILQ